MDFERIRSFPQTLPTFLRAAPVQNNHCARKSTYQRIVPLSEELLNPSESLGLHKKQPYRGMTLHPHGKITFGWEISSTKTLKREGLHRKSEIVRPKQYTACRRARLRSLPLAVPWRRFPWAGSGSSPRSPASSSAAPGGAWRAKPSWILLDDVVCCPGGGGVVVGVDGK